MRIFEHVGLFDTLIGLVVAFMMWMTYKARLGAAQSDADRKLAEDWQDRYQSHDKLLAAYREDLKVEREKNQKHDETITSMRNQITSIEEELFAKDRYLRRCMTVFRRHKIPPPAEEEV